MTQAAWWEEDLALSIDSYPLNRSVGMEACERLLSRVGLPAEVETIVRHNQTWYLSHLEDFFTPITIDIEPPIGWSQFNPSIALGPSGHRHGIVRSSNYRIDDVGRYVMPIGDNGVIKTRNYFCQFGSNWQVDGAVEMNTSQVDAGCVDYLVQGLEDCRLWWRAGWNFSATVRDRHPDGVCQIATCELEIEDDGIFVTSLDLISSRRRHEKNWMPRDDGSFIYSCAPTILRSILGGFVGNDGPWIARSFSGGSQLVPYNYGWLAVVHEVVTFDQRPVNATNRRIYQHRLVEFDGLYSPQITRISEPFCFHGKGIEFAAGLMIESDTAWISYGINDASAQVIGLPLENVEYMLFPILPEDE